MIATLDQYLPEAEFGGKASQLSHAHRKGLPVPPAFALSSAFVERVIDGEEALHEALFDAFASLAGPVAVRSSGVGEDSSAASFAGQHATVLNVRSRPALLDALKTVHASARGPTARAYRRTLGLLSEPRMGIVIQRLVHADCAGVLFTRNPMTNADERVIEATWGLGEAVVAGLVTPDHYRVARGGRVLARRAGEKDNAIRWSEEGGTVEVAVPAHEVHTLCLDDTQLVALDALASACEAAFSGTQDVEWAFAAGRLYLLQRRAITRG